MRKIKVKKKVVFLLLIILVGGFLVLSNYKKLVFNTNIDEKNPEPPKKTNFHASLIMAGDALIHSPVYDDAKTESGYNFKPMLKYIKPLVQKHELAYYNQETILGGTEIGLSTYPCFNSPYEVGDAFLDAGFNIVSLANNHTLDRGKQAIINSRKYWNKKDALISGSATSKKERDNIKIKEVDSIKYTMLAYTTTTNGLKAGNDYYVNVYNKEQVKKDIEKVRDKVDILLVSMHWGTEYNQGIDSSQREIAEYLSNLGVDIIIGAHPHVIEPIDYVGDTLVIYSLGNFISAQRGVEKLTGLMVSVDIEKDISNNDPKITISDPTAELIYTYSTYNPRANFRLYPYTKLTEKLLPNYKEYYNKFMGIVTSKTPRVIPVKLNEG